MNYTIKSIVAATEEQLLANLLEDEKHSTHQTDSFPLVGDKFILDIELIIDEAPVYMQFYCGSISGVHLVQCQANYAVIEAYPELLLTANIREILLDEFPYIVNQVRYDEHYRKAYEYLQRNAVDVTRDGLTMWLELHNGIIINLTRKDVIYYADLEDDFQLTNIP